jgi:5-methylcytosine-specific restriction protein A
MEVIVKFADALAAVKTQRLGKYEWGVLREQILARDRRRCKKCKARDKLEIDHITPVCLGGTNDPVNLQVLCDPCHEKKTVMDAERYRRVMQAREIDEQRSKGIKGFH